MKSATLSTPFLESERAVRSVNFFNGRLLTAEDMKKEQEAEEVHRRRLGRVFGEGVASGLFVSIKSGSSPATVTVKAGTAINAFGATIELPEEVEIALGAERPPARGTVSPALLADCRPPESGVYISGTGLYLLSVGPGTGLEGSAPVSGLSNPVLGGRARCCSAKHQVEGPTFRLTDVTRVLSATELAAEDTLRSTLARRLFAPDKMLSFVSDPLASSTERMVERPLVRLGLGDDRRLEDSVPLAILHWTAARGLTFADNWCVRRRPSGPEEGRGFAVQAGDARAAEAEALWRQFQDHVASITNQDGAKAVKFFTFLPPAGVLPTNGTDKTGGFSGFDVRRFFESFLVRYPVFVEGARVEHLLREARAYPPMDLASQGSRVIWVYHVRENAFAVDKGTAGVRPYVIFTTGHVPWFGDARYDVSRSNYASYA